MSSLTTTADRIALRYGGHPFAHTRVENRATRNLVAARGTQACIVRMPGRLSDPVFLDRLGTATVRNGVLRCSATDASRVYRVDLVVTPGEGGIRFDAAVTAPTPLWMFEWRLTGLDLRRVIVPALGGQALGKGMPRGTTLTYKYPFWWNAQFLVGEGPGGGIWFHTRDEEPRFKLIRMKRTATGFDLAYGIEADAPLRSRTLSATWYLDCYAGSWKTPVAIHRRWLEDRFHLTRLSTHRHFPAWARDVDMVLEMWGIGKEHPEPLHTFTQMIARLEAWKKLHPPSRTLVYLPGFAEHGIDSRAPDYRPSPSLGGAKGFRALIERAHRLGYRVMVHTNVLAMTFDHPLYPRFRKHQVVDVFRRPQGWGLDIDGDWLPEPFFAYMNPGARAWGVLMQEVIGRLVHQFGVDGVFLDQTLLAFNVARGPNFIRGMRDHILRLQTALPGVLFAGEGMHEHVVRALPMAQIHGIDSIAEVHALDGQAAWRTAHPVSTELFSPYTRFTAHLLTRHPGHPLFAAQEAAYERLGVLPALCLYDHTQSLHSPAVRAMTRRARRLSRRQG
jgi:hypothetical protein